MKKPKTLETIVTELYEKAAEFHGITVKELNRQLTEEGKSLIAQYYLKQCGAYE